MNKKRVVFILILCIFVALAGCGKNSAPTAKASVALSTSNNVDIVIAARTQIGVTTNYVADYRKIDYPNGDIPRGEGVCSDVIVRALRDSRAIDLQELMHLDMSANFSQYPRQGWAVPVTTHSDDYLPGDFVTCRVYGLPHIMVVSDRKARDGTPLVIHNIGAGTQEENALFSFQLTGHFRLPIICGGR